MYNYFQMFGPAEELVPQSRKRANLLDKRRVILSKPAVNATSHRRNEAASSVTSIMQAQ